MPVPQVTLNDGTKIPRIGFGLGTAHYGKECTSHLLSALQTGYTYIDCAEMYANGSSVKDALKQWDGKREDLYILQKCGGGEFGTKNPKEILERLLADMGIDHVDLYLLHSPLLFSPDYTLSEAWAIMEDLQASGLTKSIGVSNFREEDLLEIQKTWKVVPAVNQIEFQPYNYHAANMTRLFDLCSSENITIECYGPLTPLTKAPGGPVDPVVSRIATEKGYETSQVLLNWAAQKSKGVVVTTSANKTRQTTQLDAIREKEPLSEAEMEEISEAGKKQFKRAFMEKVWNAAKP
ncbi:aldose reductase [Cryptococcus wingfieldii CBS 7118]|uniref:Aldose reductase n=1 Tax=Cryptococcus wingfieldii CBS 7118 TaxID=1295528 RepID=A0A1E3JZH7_9TREE|nr:aldose reductase [Cryptococcus wingfieldii CBS 7118]ODO06298.1 aldose reductase [Cryptococcus wingfieldii CBS 7118]